MGDGAAAWNALNERFDAQNQDAWGACHNEMFNLRHKAGGDPIDFFTKGWDNKLRLDVLGEEVSDEVYHGVMLNGLTAAPEFRFIREMLYRDEFTSVDHLQQTANRYYIDQRSRSASGPVVWPWGGDGGRVKHRSVPPVQGVRALQARLPPTGAGEPS